MITHRLEYEMRVANDREEVYDFFNQPNNLSQLMPPQFQFCILTPKPIRMHVGTVLDYQFRFGVTSHRWSSLITECKPPFRFTDIQLKGPFSFWSHTHEFFQIPEGTLITDTLTYQIGFGYFGELLNHLVVSKALKNMFQYRKKIISHHFEAIH